MKIKSFIILLAIILSLSLCIGTVYAEDTGGTEPPPETVPEEEAPSEPSETGEAATDPDNGPAFSETASALNIQQVGNTGAAGAGIPIVVPPGRNGIAPNLALHYSSGGGNGQLGVGWGLDVGAIQRNTKRGVCYDCDDYAASINGSASELVRRSDWDKYCSDGTAYEAKIEGGFSLYCKSGQSWIVTAKDGTKYYYGQNPGSRQDGGYGIFKWCLDKVMDTNGNYMLITYAKDDGEIYLSEIEYTGNTGVAPSNSVTFEYEPRTDNPPMYAPNFRVATDYRLKNIRTWLRCQVET